jgi:putative nucleotidyltransferase with HDIG domain
MRFATRTFLWSFAPFAVLLMGSFWAIQRLVEGTVRTRLGASLRDTHASVARTRQRNEALRTRFLTVAAENASLKAGLRLLVAEPESGAARLTVEDQLREICEGSALDFLMVSDGNSAPLAAVLRAGGRLAGVDLRRIRPPQRGLLTVEGNPYQITSVPIDQGSENLGVLSAGESFDLAEFPTPTALLLDGMVLKSNVPGASPRDVERALKACREPAGCEVRLRGETVLSLPLEGFPLGPGYSLRSMQSVEAATGPVQPILRGVFLVAGLGALLAASVLSLLSSRSIVKPLSQVVAHLRECERTGLLTEFAAGRAPTQEMQQLSESFNRAAAAIREARQTLQLAHVEFTASLASALDARDRYTAGHSLRVSDFACALATALNRRDLLDEIRVGALLHDIGKIGIPDRVLQKAGRLSDEEWDLIQQHPTIGRRILEEVHGFQLYLNVVELHHENWDGTGYPHGLRGEKTPLSARIVHVVDAYDAMTTDRPYRRGMSGAEAIRVLEKYAGTQFDPEVVAAFVTLVDSAATRQEPVEV